MANMNNNEKIAVLTTLASELGVKNFPNKITKELVNLLFTGLGDVSGLSASPISKLFKYNKYSMRPDINSNSTDELIKAYSIHFSTDVALTLYHYSMTTNQKACLKTCLETFVSTKQTDFLTPATIEVVETPEKVATVEETVTVQEPIVEEQVQEPVVEESVQEPIVESEIEEVDNTSDKD